MFTGIWQPLRHCGWSTYWHTLARYCPISPHHKISDDPEVVWNTKTAYVKATHYVWHCIYIVIRQTSTPQDTRLIRHIRPLLAFGGRLGFDLFMHTHSDNHRSWFDFQSHWQPPLYPVSNHLHIRLLASVFQNVAYHVRPETPTVYLLGTGHSFRYSLNPTDRKIVFFGELIYYALTRGAIGWMPTLFFQTTSKSSEKYSGLTKIRTRRRSRRQYR